MTHQDAQVTGLPPYGETLDDLIRSQAKGRPQSIAITDAAGSWAWSEYDTRITLFARWLVSMGIETGDRVGFLVSNSKETFAALFGAMRAGGVIAPFSTMLSLGDVTRLIEDAGCKVLIVGPEWAALGQELQGQIDTKIVSLEAVVEVDHVTLPEDVSPESPCNIIYSSGTTGLPKGAVHTHSARLWASVLAANAFRFEPSSKAYLTTPPYTNGSYMMVLPAMVSGSELILETSFNVDRFIEQAGVLEPTHAFIVPTQFQMIIDAEDFQPQVFASFKCMITAGAPMPIDLKNKILDWCPNSLFELWGLTEVVATVIYPDEILTLRDSVGRTLPLSDLKLINERDEEVSVPGTGEIVARSAYQMQGYWNRDELNEEIKWTDPSGQTFMRTGDIGEIDAQGYLYIRGRVKDMIISGGINVFPVDIEEILRTHSDITDAAVIGVPHEKWGETPVAYLQTVNQSPDRDAMLEWANGKLSKFQRLSDLVFVSSDFPRNTLGKVLKRELISRYQSENSDQT